ncbi:MMPL family transporter [Alteromonas ponticola]|uniref:MMPL family transporter n=1 Tax=Alteromonas aquimaris TaxID=2998417 RepID=A0ABT3P866_9ALTE|nr:MMPL family transporter [Alteromonas aquimaris]MCW8108919.1 MMPL family transporter [Alteromonas aquimaris]
MSGITFARPYSSMITLLTRSIFFIAVLLSVLFFSFNYQHIRIDTNLNDLNPEKIADVGLKSALKTLSQDISHRFVVVVKGNNTDQVGAASQALQRALNALPGLKVISDQTVQQNYLHALSPYRFNLLSDNQRQALEDKSPQLLANDALRKLYQLGDGFRVIPFEQDPLGWFSAYVLSQFDDLDVASDTFSQNRKNVTSFVVSFSEYPQSLDEQESLYQLIKARETAVRNKFHVSVLHSGMFFFAVDSAQSAKADIQLIAVGSIIGILLLMIAIFRSLLPLFLSLSSIAIGISFGVLSSLYVFGSIHILTVVFGASLIGIVVDYSLHYFYHYLSHPQDERIRGRTNTTLFRAMLLSVLTSLIGYGALGLSDLLILKKVALFSCTGLVMAWLSVMVLGPFATRRPIHARQAALRQIIAGCRAVFARHPQRLAVTGLVLACAAGVFLFAGQAETNDDPRRFFHVSPTLLEQEQKVAQLTQIYEAGRYLLIHGQTPAAIFDSLNSMYALLGDESKSLSSVLDWLPAPESQVKNYQLQHALYSEDGVLDIFTTRIGLPKSEFTDLKTAYKEAKGKTLDFTALMKQLPSLPPLWIESENTIYSFALIRKDSDLNKIAAVSRDVDGVQYVNTLANASAALKAQRVTGSQLLLLAYVLIALMLAGYYRKLSTIFLLLIPLTASAITLTAVSLLGQSITVFHIMALFLVLGLGMDYIIFAKEMAAQRETTQQAIMLSAVTSLLSFGLLAFSSMPIVQAFGSTILIGNTINFIAAISLFNEQKKSQERRPHVR